MKRFTAFVLALIMLFALTAYADTEDKMNYIEDQSYYDKIISKEFAYISSLMFSNGAMSMFKPAVNNYSSLSLPTVDGISPDEYTKWKSGKIVPYFSHAAIFGLLQCDKVRGTKDGKDIALRYINWYISHMNTSESDINGVKGTVYDYYIFESEQGKIIEVSLYDAHKSAYEKNNPYDYDSTDSYAALFLEILDEYTACYDKSFLNDKKETVDTLVEVMLATYVESVGLTYAKPTYKACYLMDNCEVYKGFVSAENIYKNVFSDSEKSKKCGEKASTVKLAIDRYCWDEKNNCYKTGVSDMGKDMFSVDLSKFYPQASCQLFPVIFGVIAPDDNKAVITYERFKNDFIQEGVEGKDWTLFSIDGEEYPWCILLRAVVRMGDYKTARRYIRSVNGRFVNAAHSSPYYNSESGSLLQAVALLYPLAKEKSEPSESSDTASKENSESLSEISNAGSENESAEAPSSNEENGSKLPLPLLLGIGAAVIAAGTALALILSKRKKNNK